MHNLRKNKGSCNIERVDSYLTGRAFRELFTAEVVMSDKKKNEKAAPQPETNANKKTSETVQLSAEDLRKISGGAKTGNPPPITK